MQIAVIAAVVLILLGIVVFSTGMLNPVNNTTNDTNNTTMNDSQNMSLNQTNNTTNDQSQSTSNNKNQGSSSKQASQQSSNSQSNVHKSYITISENEKGQYEGMAPGRYVETWSESEGPISMDKID
ncbi:MAG: hypothetical protein BZ133_00155 [Methanosphaera sp. SHI613]|jgi:cytoskeletal protein RodZ|nr:MAG: hypothetical protein BZ133_00155 [Methanosphaera sp. SHI613]